MRKEFFVFAGFAALMFSVTVRGDIVTLEASDNATVQVAGPRGGTGGKNFFNIQGFGVAEQFRSFGVADFALTTPNPAAASVESLTIDLTQSNAGFSTSGNINFWLSTATNVDIQPGSSLVFDVNDTAHGVGSQLNDLFFLGSGTYDVEANGHVDSVTFDLTNPGLSGAQALALNSLNSGSILRMVITPDENTPGVSATYAGFSNTAFEGPTLTLNFTAIPEPGSTALLGLVSASLLLRRRRM